MLMSLEPILTDITAKLRQGKFPCDCHSELVEESHPTHQGIVLRVLQELGWDSCDHRS